jgi:hypothetical protein
MEFFDKIRELWENGEEADEHLLGQLQEYLEDLEIKKAQATEAVVKYSQTEQGKLRRRIAQRNYRARKKAKEEAQTAKL